METAAISHRVADFLKKHAPFHNVDDADLLALARGGRVRFFEPNEYILWQGEPHKYQVFVIQQGTVSLWDDLPEGAKLLSLEFNADNARIARGIWDHAGIGDQATVVNGTLGDGGQTIAAIEADHGFAAGALDFVFIDHEKSVYLDDLKRIIDQGWLREGSVAVADNVKRPGAPDYREYMQAEEGRSWRTTEHETHVEYQTLLKDLVLESEFLAT